MTTQEQRSKHGLVRKLISNMATGVSKGFTRVLEINGVGYRAEVKGTNINSTLGYSHPIVYQLPPAVTAKVDRQVIVTLESADRQLLGISGGADSRIAVRPSRTREKASSTRTERSVARPAKPRPERQRVKGSSSAS